MKPSDSTSATETASSAGSITTLEGLREHLQWALELEHSTIPPYLCALYSIKAGHNTEAIEVLNSILVEEMLHLTLAANLLNSVGGQPRLDTPQMLQTYPRPLPHSADSFEIPLLRFSPEALETFLKIEQPSPKTGPAEGNHYETIGQFYEAIQQGFRELSTSLGERNVFCGDPARQIMNHPFYSGGGSIVAVTDLASALAAMAEIVEQGEGAGHAQVWDGDTDVFHPDRDQVAHYYRFSELKLGRRYQRGDTPRSGPTGDPVAVDWNAVHPMRANPRSDDHLAGTPVRLAQEEFNRSYCMLLRLLEQVFNGAPQMLGSAFGGMYTLKSQAQNLMQMANEDGDTTAGPSFEYVASELRTVAHPQ